LISFPENFTKYLESLGRNSERLYRLTEDILDVTRIESDTLKLNKEKFDMHKLVIDTINDFTNKFKNPRRNNFKVVYDNSDSKDEDDIIIVYADKNRIQLVISNLIDNAYKFTENGDITVRIKKEIYNQQVKISIQDEGKGIDKEILPKLFTKFTTKSESGTGLGLYISKKIIEAHGGKIWVHNNNNKNYNDNNKGEKGRVGA